ncbi:DUF5994 family protein [Mycobacterium sp. B14F4]|uniref:DUF5994 family protein n=1 Tax=Mycobacterium sp. B14F4 TaxID=3153565 RepID=UPI00325D65DD
MTDPIRLTLAPQIDDNIGGAWWPYTASMARELPALIERLHEPLGEIVDISINWTALQGVPNLDQFGRSGTVLLPGQEARPHRVMTVTGSRAHAHLLIVPSDTTKGLAVLVLRCAADLPVLATHQHTDTFRAAESIVRTARAQHAESAVV